MFIELDLNKKKIEPVLHLAKPNMKIVSPLGEAYNVDYKTKVGALNEISFTLPYKINERHRLVDNKNTKLARERFLVKLTLGYEEEWFVIKDIQDDGDEIDSMSITCMSLGFELGNTRIYSYQEDSVKLTDVANTVLLETNWSLGHVDDEFLNLYRAYDFSNVTALDAILQIGETLGAVIVWDTKNRRIDFRNVEKISQHRGMSINYGKYLKSISRERTTDEMVTRLVPYGNDDLMIHDVNPTGTGYIEDFTYFMYPFQRDENRNVIKSSYYMSDALCHAIIDYNEKIRLSEESLKSLIEEVKTKKKNLSSAEIRLEELNAQMNVILDKLDVAKATEDSDLISSLQEEKNAKQTEIDEQASTVSNARIELSQAQDSLNNARENLSLEDNFTPELIEERKLYIIEREWRDDKYISSQDLYDDAIKTFHQMREPSVVINIDIVNLFEIIEEQHKWDKLKLGDKINIKHPIIGINSQAMIIEINYNFEGNSISLTISNTKDIESDEEKFVKMLYNNSNVGATVQSSKHKWNKINEVDKSVISLLEDEWNAVKQQINAGVDNSVTMSGRGIVVRNTKNPNEVIVIQSGVVALSKDNGETWKTAIKPDGIISERLIGKIIIGQELIMTNSNGNFTFDTNGATFKVGSFRVESADSSENLVEKWIDSSRFVDEIMDDNMVTPYEKKILLQEWKRLETTYNKTVDIVNSYWNNLEKPIEAQLYYDRYEELYSYLFVDMHGDKPLLDPSNMGFATRIDRDTFNSKFRNLDTAYANLDKVVDLRRIALINNAEQIAKDTQDKIDDIQNDIVYKIDFYSPKGFTFKNGVINTTITVTVWKGSSDITSTIPNTGFIWRKKNKDGVLDVVWTDSHKDIGKTIQITRDDIDEKTIFECDIKSNNEVISSGLCTVIDLNDTKQLTSHISSTQRRNIIFEPTDNIYIPDYSVTPNVLTPELFIAGQISNIANQASSVRWYYQDETMSSPVEIISNTEDYTLGTDKPKTLTIKKNVLETKSFIKYICQIEYTDESTGFTVPTKAEYEISKVLNGSIGKDGEQGKDAVYAIVWTPNGNMIKGNDDSLTAKIDIYEGSDIVEGESFKWYYQDPTATITNGGDADGGNGWRLIKDESSANGITGYTTSVITIPASSIVNLESFKCITIYNETKYQGVVTIVDATEPQIQIFGVNTFKNGQGSVQLTARIYKNGIESDANGSLYNYVWKVYDLNGEIDSSFNKSGKTITVNANEVNSIVNLLCDIHEK